MENNIPFKIDDFWNDCINKQKKDSLKCNKKPYSSRINKNKKMKVTKTNNNKYLRNLNHNNLSNNKTQVHISAIDKFYKRLNKKYPELFINKPNNKINKKRIENSLLKSKILYEEAFIKKQLIEKNMEENIKNKINEELSLCTFRPNAWKRRNEDEYIQPYYKKIYERDFSNLQKTNICHKSAEIYKKSNLSKENIDNENKSKEKIKRLKKTASSISQELLREKGKAKFYLRYTKARDEKIIKIFKKLYKKDDSYDYYLNSLTSRLGNNEYKNTLNVNNSIPLYGESISRNNHINSFNSYIGDFKGLSFKEDISIKQSKKTKRLIMNEIRKGLMEIDLKD